VVPIAIGARIERIKKRILIPIKWNYLSIPKGLISHACMTLTVFESVDILSVRENPLFILIVLN
jgi:hypothetical protein